MEEQEVKLPWKKDRFKEFLVRDFWYILVMLIALFACFYVWDHQDDMLRECNDHWLEQWEECNCMCMAVWEPENDMDVKADNPGMYPPPLENIVTNPEEYEDGN